MDRRIHCLSALVSMLFLVPSGVPASDLPLSGNCGYMCHVPMAGEDGGSRMSGKGLRPLEGDFAQMKARFDIRPDQEAAWKRFADEVNRPMPDWHREMLSNPPATSAERAKFMEQVWRHRYEHMEAVTNSFQDLYQVLDDQQKRVANQRFGYCELNR